MSTYGRFTPYLLNSTIPDRSTNSLPAAVSEDFVVGVNRVEMDLHVPAANDPGPNTHVPIYLSGWDTVSCARVQVSNTGDVLLYLIFVPVGLAGNTPFFEAS